MRKLVFAVSIATAISASPASGQGYSGNSLFEDCIAEISIFTDMFCLGFVVGVISAYTGPYVSLLSAPTTLFCLPENVSHGQAKDIVKKYMTDHPDRRHFPGESLVFGAIVEAFPCPPK